MCIEVAWIYVFSGAKVADACFCKPTVGLQTFWIHMVVYFQTEH